MQHFIPTNCGDEVDTFAKGRGDKMRSHTKVTKGYRRRERRVLNAEARDLEAW